MVDTKAINESRYENYIEHFRNKLEAEIRPLIDVYFIEATDQEDQVNAIAGLFTALIGFVNTYPNGEDISGEKKYNIDVPF